MALLVISVIAAVVLVKPADKDVNSTDTSTPTVSQEAAPAEELRNLEYRNPVNKEATVHLVEYADFQCPFCARLQPVVDELKDYNDEFSVDVEFRHFPLESIHPNAMAGHRAAEAAGMQGKFYEMHDLLFENQLEWTSAQTSEEASAIIRSKYATQLNLDIEQYRKDTNSTPVDSAIRTQYSKGLSLGITGTPTIFYVANYGESDETLVKMQTPSNLEEFIQNINELNEQYL